MRTISQDKGNFLTKGNTNGVYNFMQRNVNQSSRDRFNRPPYYMTVGKKK